MWEWMGNTLGHIFGWLIARRDTLQEKQNQKDRSDFELVTGGYTSLVTILQGRVEGLIKEVADLKIREDRTQKEHDEYKTIQNERYVNIVSQLRACKVREQINAKILENLNDELKQAKTEIRELIKRCDIRDNTDQI